MTMTKPLMMVAALTMLANCATVTRGTDDTLLVTSEPAGAQVVTSNGFACDSTPCNLVIPRKSEFTVTVSKAGCRPAQVAVTNETGDAGAAGMAGNVLIGGVIGIGVDAASGATLDLVPNPVAVTLQC